MPAERTSFGALADITVTTSYRGRALLQQIQTPKESIVLTNNQTKATCPSFFKFFGCFLENNIALTFLYLRANIDIGNIRKDSKEHDKTWETNLLAGEWKNASTSKLCMSTHNPSRKRREASTSELCMSHTTHPELHLLSEWHLQFCECLP